jgi:hypothetical protein
LIIPNTTVIDMSAHSLAELAPSSCEPEQASPGSSSESYLAPVCGTDFGSSLIEVAEDVDPESQLEKKASAIHTVLKKHGHFLALLVILAIHTILALSGRSSPNYNLSSSGKMGGSTEDYWHLGRSIVPVDVLPIK